MSATLEGGILSRKRKQRVWPEIPARKLNVDHIQSKLVERSGKVVPDCDRWNTREAWRDVERGVRYFWGQRGMTPPLPEQAWDPFLSNGKGNNNEVRALKKVTT